MSDWPINMLDAVVIVIIVLSAIVSVVRGFVREVLAIASWVGAALVTLYGLPYARPYLREVVDQPLIADAITGVVLFVVALMVFSLISHLLAKGVRGAALTGIDRLLGLVFGVARGALLVCLGYLVLVWLMPEEDRRPEWMTDAKSAPYLADGAAFLQSLVPEDLLMAGASEVEEQVRDQLDLTGPPAPGGETPEDTSGDLDREGINQLIENTEEPGSNQQ